MDFFISDLHLGGRERLLYDGAPFPSPAEMADALVRNWNAAVGEDDRVFVLGDVADVRNEENAELLRSLKGHKTLVMGNNDGRGDAGSERWFLEAGFERVYPHPIVVKGFFILSHEPLFLGPAAPFSNIFGHVHAHPAIATETAQTFCACACRHNYTPVRYYQWDATRTDDMPSPLGFAEPS